MDYTLQSSNPNMETAARMQSRLFSARDGIIERRLDVRGLLTPNAVEIAAAAHRGAVKAGGRTVAVLGCGLDVDYPRKNRELFEKIVECGGALVSEYSLGAQPEAWRFRFRNRVLSGMCLGVGGGGAPEERRADNGVLRGRAGAHPDGGSWKHRPPVFGWEQ